MPTTKILWYKISLQGLGINVSPDCGVFSTPAPRRAQSSDELCLAVQSFSSLAAPQRWVGERGKSQCRPPPSEISQHGLSLQAATTHIEETATHFEGTAAQVKHLFGRQKEPGSSFAVRVVVYTDYSTGQTRDAKKHGEQRNLPHSTTCRTLQCCIVELMQTPPRSNP